MFCYFFGTVSYAAIFDTLNSNCRLFCSLAKGGCISFVFRLQQLVFLSKRLWGAAVFEVGRKREDTQII